MCYRLDFKTTLLRGAIALLAGGVVVCLALTRAAAAPPQPTNFVRELAKNRPPVVIVSSGAMADPIAHALQSAILNHPENHHQPADVAIVTPADVAQYSDADSKRPSASFVWLLARREMSAQVSDAVVRLIPVRLADVPDGGGIAHAEIVNTPDRGTAFAVALVAPDGDRLARLYDIFTARTTLDFRALAFTEQFQAYRLAIFSSEAVRSGVAGWEGLPAENRDPHLWIDARWFPLDQRDKLAPEQVAGCNQVYFVSRSANDPVPLAAKDLLGSPALKDTTVLIKSVDAGNGAHTAVFSAPNGMILSARAEQYPSFDRIPDGLVQEEVTDLRRIGPTALVTSGAGPSPADREAIRLQVASAMREDLKLDVRERNDASGAIEAALADLQAGGAARDQLRQGAKVKCVWLFTLTDYSGSTEYRSTTRLLGKDKLIPYESAHAADDPEPQLVIEAQGGGRKAEIERKTPAYKAAHDAWLRRKGEYEEREQRRLRAHYDRRVSSAAHASVKGVLRLVDLDDNARVLWERECEGRAEAKPVVVQSDTEDVRLDREPTPLPQPPNTADCSAELLHDAGARAGRRALRLLQATAWLPDGSQPAAAVAAAPAQPAPAAPQPAAAPAPPAPTGPVVADVDAQNGVVTVAIDAGSDVKAGDRAFVMVQKRDITDPRTGKVIRTVSSGVLLKVKSVDGPAAVCIPASPAEAAKLGQVKAGMPVKTAHPQG